MSVNKASWVGGGSLFSMVALVFCSLVLIYFEPEKQGSAESEKVKTVQHVVY